MESNLNTNNSKTDSLENSKDNLIFDKEILTGLPTCPICDGIIINPYQCNNCENCFCYCCIKNVYEKCRECPSCLETLNISKSELMEKYLSLFQYKCLDCQKQMEYKEYISHFSVCPKINIKEKYFSVLKEEENIEEKLKTNEENTKTAFKKVRPNTLIWEGVNYNTLKDDELFISENHAHALLHIAERGDYTCDICQKDSGIDHLGISYCCIYCDFDICPLCWQKEKEMLKEFN